MLVRYYTMLNEWYLITEQKYIWNDFLDFPSISYLYKSWLGPVAIRLFDKHFGSDFNGEIVICIS